MIVTTKPHRLAAKWDKKNKDLVADVSPRFGRGDIGLLFDALNKEFLSELQSRGYDLGTLRFQIDKTPEAIEEHEVLAGRGGSQKRGT